jgi:hypothetical protein
LSLSILPTGNQTAKSESNQGKSTLGDMAPDTPEDMSLAQQKSVRALVKALNAIAARLRREREELALTFGVGALENYDETFCLFDCALRVSNCGC